MFLDFENQEIGEKKYLSFHVDNNIPFHSQKDEQRFNFHLDDYYNQCYRAL